MEPAKRWNIANLLFVVGRAVQLREEEFYD
jgi:hypothetical protein